MTKVEVFAPAKINLTLHITGQRKDGYHLLDSIVMFADVGDTLTLNVSGEPSLKVVGPFGADVPDGPDNLVVKATTVYPEVPSLAITLDKRLPAASGIGGGSADAAAVLRGSLSFFLGDEEWGALDGYSDERLKPQAEAILALGADVPMCLLCQSSRISGIGEKVVPLVSVPNLPAILVNPQVAVSTPRVFSALAIRNNAPMPGSLPDFQSVEAFARWLATQRNDLERPAKELHPQIGDAIEAIETTSGVLLARMSGSGATCFGIYPDRETAEAAARAIAQDHPGWWVQSCTIGGQRDRALPVVS